MSSKGTIHDRFRLQAEALQAEAAAIAASVTATGQRPWQTGDDDSKWDGDPLNIGGITLAFDRSDIGQAYASCLSDPSHPGSTADAMALKLQSDWLAMQERAFRCRHETSVRAAVHAAARRAGHAHEKGVIKTGVIGYVQTILKQGA